MKRKTAWYEARNSLTVLVIGMLVLCPLFCMFSGEEKNEAQIDKVDLSGILSPEEPFSLRMETTEIGPEEIRTRLKQLPLYGANPVGTSPRQRVMRAVTLTVKEKPIIAPEAALRDLFDPGFVYTLHVTKTGNQIIIAWAGGSGEREYRCKLYATSERFILREIYQLDNQSREMVWRKEL